MKLNKISPITDPEKSNSMESETSISTTTRQRYQGHNETDHKILKKLNKITYNEVGKKREKENKDGSLGKCF